MNEEGSLVTYEFTLRVSLLVSETPVYPNLFRVSHSSAYNSQCFWITDNLTHAEWPFVNHAK